MYFISIHAFSFVSGLNIFKTLKVKTSVFYNDSPLLMTPGFIIDFTKYNVLIKSVGKDYLTTVEFPKI